MKAGTSNIDMRQYDLIAAGEINPDLILSRPGLTPIFGQQEILVDAADLTIGSSSAIFACGAARLGLKVAFIGVVGEDMFGQFMLQGMAERGIDVTHVIHSPSLQTGLSVILNRGTDRAILTHLGAISALRAEHIPNDLLKQARHLHVASYFLQTALQPGLYDLFSRAKTSGLTTSLDTNWDPAGEWAGVRRVLEQTDIFFPNEAEAQALADELDLEHAARKLGAQAGAIAIKQGHQGASAYRRGEWRFQPALRVQVVDTVGAGDSFDAGFLYGFLKDWELGNCLQLGIACGSLSTQAAGGTAAQPTLEEALLAIQELN